MACLHIVGVFVRSERHVTAIPKSEAATCAGHTYHFVPVDYPRVPRILIVAMIALVYSRDQRWE